MWFCYVVCLLVLCLWCVLYALRIVMHLGFSSDCQEHEYFVCMTRVNQNTKEMTSMVLSDSDCFKLEWLVLLSHDPVLVKMLLDTARCMLTIWRLRAVNSWFLCIWASNVYARLH